MESIRFRVGNGLMEVVGSLGLRESIDAKKTNRFVCIKWFALYMDGYGMSLHC